MEIIIWKPQEMFDLWNELSKSNSHIFLNWELWAWKTLFVKWFVNWLWLDPVVVQSPTYTIVNIYWDKVLHMDMYRIESVTDLIDKWLIDLISNYEYVLIEWPKFIIFYDDYPWLNVDISKIDFNTRKVLY